MSMSSHKDTLKHEDSLWLVFIFLLKIFILQTQLTVSLSCAPRFGCSTTTPGGHPHQNRFCHDATNSMFNEPKMHFYPGKRLLPSETSFRRLMIDLSRKWTHLQTIINFEKINK